MSFTDARCSTFNNVGGDQNIFYTHNEHLRSPEHYITKLKPAQMDASTRSECLPGTRTNLLKSIKDWVYLLPDHRILWLHGLAGSGKSTLATSVANSFREQGRLGAFLFFNRDVEERSCPSNVIRTIAHQLCSFDARLATEVLAVIEATPAITQSPIQLQFRKLVIEPLSKISITELPVVLVLDALDECGHAGTRAGLLALLAKESVHLPKFIRILITSRPESDLRTGFVTKSHVLAKELDLASQSNLEDILSYLRSRMETIRSKNPSLSLRCDWPGEMEIQALAQHAAGLFVWAATACRFIDGHDPRKRIHIILRKHINTDAESALDALYRTALESSGMWDDEDFRSDFCSIMGTILGARNPLSDNAIDTLLSLDRPSRHTILKLGCVLRWSETEPVQIIHPSFADFLSDSRRCGSASWYIDTTLHNYRLATCCISHLMKVLKRNICNVTLSQVAVDVVLPEATSYAAISWVEHICMVTDDAESLTDLLEGFLFQHLLHWLEAVSILKKSRATVASLRELHDWLHIHLWHRRRLCELISDASRFVQTFADLIEEHHLLVYLTALPFTPVDTILFQTFADQDVPLIVNKYHKTWSPLLQVLSGHLGHILSVACSADGRLIVSGSEDRTVRVWDMLSGIEIVSPLRGHEGPIYSVAISPNGRYVVSGSKDHTLRVWDIASGLDVFGPLASHCDTVSAVSFAGDGLRIVSGSWDGTVRLWDAISGTEILPPLQQLPGTVQSVSFSADGHRIVSAGSDDCTIRVWDAISGAQICSLISPPLCQDVASGMSVAFSSDGTSLVSCSGDQGIRMWDIGSGINTLEVVEPDAGFLHSVIFSPDNRIIASGGGDGAIHRWDASSFQKVSPPLSVTSSIIDSVAFSPDGRLVLSGSRDSKIRVWDALFERDSVPTREGDHQWSSGLQFSPDGTCILHWGFKAICLYDAHTAAKVVSLIPHKRHFNLALFSPDSKRILSGSYDGSIQVWDTLSGLEVLAPRGHDGAIRYMRYAPDGMQFASTGRDNTFRVWNALTGAEVFMVQRSEEHFGLMVFSPDGGQIVIIAREHILVWDANTGAELTSIAHPQAVGLHPSLTFSPDGLHVICSFMGPSKDHFRHVETWDIISATMVAFTKLRINPRCGIQSSVIVTLEGWVVDIAAQKVLGKLPPTVLIRSWAASPSGESVAFIPTDTDEPCIMQFPRTMLTFPGTWDPSSIILDDGEREQGMSYVLY